MLMRLGRGVDKLFTFLFVLVLSEWLWQGVASRFLLTMKVAECVLHW
jgi:hypothetical protein